eukprot:1361535-Amorphochlora_amoeboformis.AAC.2
MNLNLIESQLEKPVCRAQDSAKGHRDSPKHELKQMQQLIDSIRASGLGKRGNIRREGERAIGVEVPDIFFGEARLLFVG